MSRRKKCDTTTESPVWCWITNTNRNHNQTHLNWTEVLLFRAVRCQVMWKHSLRHLYAHDNSCRKKAGYFRFVLQKINLLDMTLLFVSVRGKKLLVTVKVTFMPDSVFNFIVLDWSNFKEWSFFLHTLAGSLQMLGIPKMTEISSWWHLILEEEKINRV